MNEQVSPTPKLSAWWRRRVLLVFVVGMIGLIFMSVHCFETGVGPPKLTKLGSKLTRLGSGHGEPLTIKDL